MPHSSWKPCAGAMCGRRVPARTRFCDACRRKAEAARGTHSQRGYTARWERYRLLYLQQHPLCVLCAAAATVVDHVVAHKGDERLFWDDTNHRALCKPCHDARVDEGDFGVRL